MLPVETERVNGGVVLFERRPVVAGIALRTVSNLVFPINHESGAFKSFGRLCLPAGILSYRAYQINLIDWTM